MLVLIYAGDKLQILNDYGDSNFAEYSEATYNMNTANVGFDITKFSFAFTIKSDYEDINIGDGSDLFDISVYLKTDRRGMEDEKLGMHQCNEADFAKSFPDSYI